MSETSHKWNDFTEEWTRGRQLELDLAVTKTQSGTETAQDITGGVVRVTGKLDLADLDAAALFRLSSAVAEEIEITSPTGGTAIALIPAAATAGLPETPTVVYVDCVWINDAGKPYSFRKGTITFYGSGETLT